MNEPIIKLDHIDVTFNQKKRTIKAVQDVTIHINQGDIYGIVGYSGAGKSTLVRVVNLLQEPSAGQITIDGQVIYNNKVTLNGAQLRERRREIGMIFQHFNLMSQLTAEQNVAFALKHAKLSKEDKKKKVKELLELVGLSDRAQNYPSQLSGGQKQRVAIARALANDPKILISDESTSALDPKTTKQILALLQDLNKKLGLTIVLITHEMQIVKDIANRVAVMQNGELIEEGSVLEIFSHPNQTLTKDFIQVATGIEDAMSKIEQQKVVKELAKGSNLVKLKYAGQSTDEPILNEIYKKHQVTANILYGNIEILDNVPVGEMIVVLSGQIENLTYACQDLREAGVELTILKEGKQMVEWIQNYLPNVYQMGWSGNYGWATAIQQTLYMTFWSFLIGGIMGLLGGLFLVLTGRRGVIANGFVFNILDKTVSLFRAIPFIILLAFISPVTRSIVGTTLGSEAALVPLSLAVFPFFARQVQVVLAELDGGVIEAAQASGGTLFDIIGVYLSEGLPDLVRVSTVTLISLVGETAMAGAIGAGGLGSVAISKGYNYSRDDITLVATILILVLIFLIQFLGDFLTKKLSHK